MFFFVEGLYKCYLKLKFRDFFNYYSSKMPRIKLEIHPISWILYELGAEFAMWVSS